MSLLRIGAECLAVAGAYVLGAQIGFRLAFLHSQVSPVWPPEGIALAVVLVRRWRVIPGVVLGAFSANFLNNPDFPTAALIAVGNTASVALSAALVFRLTGGGNPFLKARHVILYLTIGTMPGAAISALVGVTSLHMFGFVPAAAYQSVVMTWWTGEMQGFAIVAPFLFSLSQRPDFGSLNGRRIVRRIVEGIFLVFALIVLSIFVFDSKFPLVYLPIPLLLWAVFRFQLHGATLATIAVSLIATFFTIQHRGPFAPVTGETISLNSSLLLLELYIGFAGGDGAAGDCRLE